MPKETIDSIARDTLNRPVPGNPDAVFADPLPYPLRVQVGWSATEYPTVQVSTVCPAVNLAGQLLEQKNADGFYVHLDRDGINRLIRALRKARDAAFGADA